MPERGVRACLEDGALVSVSRSRLREEDGANGLVEYLFESLLRERGALDEADSAHLACHRETLLGGDGRRVLLSESLDGLWVVAKVELGAHEHDRRGWTVVTHFWIPLQTTPFTNT